MEKNTVKTRDQKKCSWDNEEPELSTAWAVAHAQHEKQYYRFWFNRFTGSWIGIILSITAIASGVRHMPRAKGTSLLYWLSLEGGSYSWGKNNPKFSGKSIKGAIIAPVLEGTAEIEHLFNLKMTNFPFVLLENVKGIQTNVVSIDNIKAMKEANEVPFNYRPFKDYSWFAGTQCMLHIHMKGWWI